jgi:hypothetical protein
MTKLMALVAESAALWRKHGAEVTVWAVSAGEVGNMVFSARYESFEAYGKCNDALYADPAFQAWQIKGTASGLSSWVRSNLARQLPI